MFGNEFNRDREVSLPIIHANIGDNMSATRRVSSDGQISVQRSPKEGEIILEVNRDY